MTWLIAAVVLVVIMIALSLAAGAAWEAEIRHFGRFLRTMFQRGQHKGPMLPSETAPRTMLVGRPGANERTVPRKDAAGRPPWPTAGQPVLTETGEQRRLDTIKSQLPNPKKVTPDEMLTAMASAMASVSAIPVFGEAPQLEVEPELAKQVTS